MSSYKIGVIFPSRGLADKRAYMQRYRLEHKEEIKASRRVYHLAHKEENNARNRERARIRYYLDKEADNERSRVWRRTHRLEGNEYARDYYKENYTEGSQYRLRNVLRSRLLVAIKGNQKTGSAVSDLGCSVDELKVYLEGQFQKGMTWSNWARKGWHIDHKVPLASFDLTDREQLLKAVHYTNLQPMWHVDNLKKGPRCV